ncbi:unnamed protein product [Withania somnifera]
MESHLQPVRHRRTGDVLFYRKSHPPFKIDPHLIDLPKNSSADVFPSKNVQVTSNFQKAATDEQVMLYIREDYGFWENLQCLEKKIPSSNPYKDRSKNLGELPILSYPRAIIEDVKNLSQDIYNLSSPKDMLNLFMLQDLL